jgi:hypothetical protein
MQYVSPMNTPPLLRRTLTPSLIALVAALALGVNVAAAAANEIEGVWSFEHGSVAIVQQPNGTFTGTVVEETTFNACPHAAGEVMWTGMTEQPDGSFWGLHQWFVKNADGTCEPDPRGLGPTAWRVLHNSAGERALKVCFSHPATSQPKIAPEGVATETTFGCYESALLAPVPTTTGGSGSLAFSKTVILPTECVNQTSLTIKLKDPKYDPLKKVVVKIKGKTVAAVKGIKKVRKGITLKKLPTGTFTLSVVATTVLNQRLSGSQTYKSCTAGSGKIKLHKVKHH